MGRTEQVRTVDTPDFYNTINIHIEKSIWLYVINNISLLATLLRVCKVIRLLAQVTWQHEWVAKIWTVHKSVILFLELEFCIKRRREHSPCWLLPEMRQSSFFFCAAANFAIAAAVYCLFWFLLQHEAYFLHSALFCVCSLAATSPGFANNNNRLVQGLTKYSFWLRHSLLSLPLMLIGRSELTKLVAHPHKEPNICCLIRPDKNTHVTFVSPL